MGELDFLKTLPVSLFNNNASPQICRRKISLMQTNFPKQPLSNSKKNSQRNLL